MDTLLSSHCKERYASKVQLANGIDPYETTKEEWEDNIDLWPAITYVHVCMFMILYPSPYTQDDMLNYKSLESFKQFQNGWVREVLVKKISVEKRLMIGKVNS